jgi:hypothetical protein
MTALTVGLRILTVLAVTELLGVTIGAGSVFSVEGETGVSGESTAGETTGAVTGLGLGWALLPVTNAINPRQLIVAPSKKALKMGC